MSRGLIVIAALVAGAGLAVLTFRVLSTEAGTARSAPSESPAEPSHEVTHERTDSIPLAEASRTEEEGGAGVVPSETEGPEHLPAGTLHLRVNDGVTGNPLAEASVRFLGELRYAETRTDPEGQVSMRLSPGPYEVGVQLDGYERCRLEEVLVSSEAEQELPGVSLWPGSGRIEGQLAATGVERDRPFLVELRGVGRNPCRECRSRFRPEPTLDATAPKPKPPGNIVQLGGAEGQGFSLRLSSAIEDLVEESHPVQDEEPAAKVEEEGALASLVPESTCAHCGFDEKVSTLEVWPGGSFRFENLCSGPYRLLARRDTKSASAAEAIVELEPEDSRHVRLLARETTEVEFELRDPEGVAFDGNWLEEGEGEEPVLRSSNIRYRFRGEGRRVATASVQAAARPGSQPQPRSFSMSFGSIMGVQNESDRDDRARAEDDSLWPHRDPPGASGAKLAAERVSDTLHRILELPCRPLEVEVLCGPWRSAPIPLDLSFPVPQPVVITLERSGPEELSAVVEGGGGVFQLQGLRGVMSLSGEGDGE